MPELIWNNTSKESWENHGGYTITWVDYGHYTLMAPDAFYLTCTFPIPDAHNMFIEKPNGENGPRVFSGTIVF